MHRRILTHSLDHHVELRIMHRSFPTLAAAQKFAAGKEVDDIYRANGRFVVEYRKTVRADYDADGFPIKH